MVKISKKKIDKKPTTEKDGNEKHYTALSLYQCERRNEGKKKTKTATKTKKITQSRSSIRTNTNRRCERIKKQISGWEKNHDTNIFRSETKSTRLKTINGKNGGKIAKISSG